MKVQLIFVLLAIAFVSCEEETSLQNFNPVEFLTCLGDGFSTIEDLLNQSLEAAKTLDFVKLAQLWPKILDAAKSLVDKCFSNNSNEVELTTDQLLMSEIQPRRKFPKTI